MMILVDDALSEILKERFAYIKAHPSELYKILNISSSKIGELVAFMSDKHIKVTKAYPRTPTELPCISILLGDDEETQNGLGDACEEEGNYTTLSTTDVVSVSENEIGEKIVNLHHFPIDSITSITNVSLNSLVDDNLYYITDIDLGIIGISDDNVDVGDSLQVTYVYKNKGTENTQIMYESNYKLEVWSNNSDLTSQLYTLVKWALIYGRGSLITDYGIFRQRLSGTDLNPVSSFAPEIVYRRGVNFWCQYDISVEIEEVSYISKIETNQNISFDGG